MAGWPLISLTSPEFNFPAIPPGKTNNKMNIEVHEMNMGELEEVSGGMWPIFFAGLAATAVGFLTAGVVENWEDFKKGVVEGYSTFE